MTKETVLSILELIEDSLEFRTDRNNSIRPIDQLLLTLRFYATKKFLVSSGDFHNARKKFCIKDHQKGVFYNCIFVANQMPQGEQIAIAQRDFYSIARISRVIRSIDMLVFYHQVDLIQKIFENRKGFFSLNDQTVSSVNLKILDIVAR